MVCSPVVVEVQVEVEGSGESGNIETSSNALGWDQLGHLHYIAGKASSTMCHAQAAAFHGFTMHLLLLGPPMACPCRYEAHQKLGLPTILCRVRKANQEVLKMHMM